MPNSKKKKKKKKKKEKRKKKGYKKKERKEKKEKKKEKEKEKEIKKIFNSTSKPTHSSNFAALTNQPQKRIAQWLRRLRKLYRPSLGHRNLSLLVLPTPKTTKTPQPPSTTTIITRQTYTHCIYSPTSRTKHADFCEDTHWEE